MILAINHCFRAFDSASMTTVDISANYL